MTEYMKNQVASKSVLLILAIFSLSFLVNATNAQSNSDPVVLSISVDATELPRKLLYSNISMSLDSDTVSLLYPKWIPGIHGPRGPVENLAGFTITDSDNKKIKWERDADDVYRFFIYPNSAPSSCNISLRYITNQPSTQSKGIDSYGYAGLGIIDWNTCLVYPEGINIENIMVDLTLILPDNWEFGSALVTKSTNGNETKFERVTLEQLIDKPLICGEYSRTIELATTKMAKYYLDIITDNKSNLKIADSVMAILSNLPIEAEAIFGRTHFDKYHLLLILSDEVPRIGLEHRNSSLNSGKSKDLTSWDNWKKSGLPYLLPHEFAHAWCGKYRRPEGMYTADYQETKDTDYLWVYEGLDQYLGKVLAVRAGYADYDRFKESLARSTGGKAVGAKRKWRPLRDTEASGFILRGGSKSWSYLRGSQDYYGEGAFIWQEFDARIRTATKGKKSLDDFCAKFFSNGDPDAVAVPFDLDEIVTTLNSISENNWAELIDKRVYQTQESFSLEGLTQTGYSLTFTDEKSKELKSSEKKYKWSDFQWSLGFWVTGKDKIKDVVPGSIADSAGLYAGVKLVGVNGMKYSNDRLNDAIKETTSSDGIILLTLTGERFKEFVLKYDGGLKYYELKRIDKTKDWLEKIYESKTD